MHVQLWHAVGGLLKEQAARLLWPCAASQTAGLFLHLLHDHAIFHEALRSSSRGPQLLSCMLSTAAACRASRSFKLSSAPWPSSSADLLSGPPALHLLQAWRIYQRGLERWLADLLQPVFDSLITDHTGEVQLHPRW